MARLGFMISVLVLHQAICLSQTATDQPQWRAPWRGTKTVTQGNNGDVSHNVCGHRSIDKYATTAAACSWENSFAIDVSLNYEEVLAPADGDVIYACDDIKKACIGDAQDPMGGRQMALSHVGPDGSQYITVYLHLSQIKKFSGHVTQGDVIAISGNSSRGSESGAMRPHLHFHVFGAKKGSYDSHTQYIETLLLKRVDSDTGFRQYDSRRNDLDVTGVAFESNCDCSSRSSASYRPSGKLPVHPSGSLVKTASSGAVYLLRGPDSASQMVYRIGLGSPEVLHNPFNQVYSGDQFVFNDVVTISEEEMMQYPLLDSKYSRKTLPGNGLSQVDGRLIIKPGGGEIAIVSNGQRRAFPSADVFTELGFRYCNVIEDSNYDSYPAGVSVNPVGTSESGGSGASAAAQMVSPTPGSTLSGSTASFSWSSGAKISEYWLRIGSSPNGREYYEQSQGTGRSQVVSGLPTDGRTLYVRIFSRYEATGDWYYYEYTYHAANLGGVSVTPAAAQMTSPTPGSTLSGPMVLFSWSAGAKISEYWLRIGSSPNGREYYEQSQGTGRSQVVSGLPTDGRTLYVRIFSRYETTGDWYYYEYTYHAANFGGASAAPAAAQMTSPIPGSTLSGSTVLFSWSSGAKISEYWLRIGNSPNGKEYYEQSQGMSRSQIVSGLPTDGRTLYVRIFSRYETTGDWYYYEYTYRCR